MIKNLLFVAALFSLALASGCAKGGNGISPQSPSIDVTITSPANVNPSDIYPTQTVTVQAAISNSTTTTVTWSVSPSGTGTLTPVTPPTNPPTATYVAPSSAGSQPTITATLTGDTGVTGTLPLAIVDVTTDVAPASLSVGSGLVQQFTAVAVPDYAPQVFTWTCSANGVPCANFVQDPNVSGLAYYTEQDSCSNGNDCVQISATATLDPAGCTANPTYCIAAKASLVPNRVNGTYAFQFSGYDGSGNATSVVGTFTASNGAITSGVEDELTSAGPAQHAITGGSYIPISASDPNSNNAGTLTLTTGAYPNTFQVVLDGAGDIEMIESDGQGKGSGVAQKSSSPGLFTGDQTYAFGFSGVDSTGKRVGYVGVLPMNGSGSIVAGQMDTNDNGSTSNVCGASPCSITGTYTGPSASGFWHMSLTSPGATLGFDFFMASGSASKGNPLTFYAISTDLTANPAVSGTMVLQDSTQTYNNAAFKGISVSALTGANGANSNVALVLGSTDGNGNFSGQFDQNNAGTVLSAISFPPSGSADTYAASGTNGRYTFQMLGNPTAKTVVPPIPFVLYASGQNRGFLLDQSSSSVMTGTMNPQGKGSGVFANSELPGTFAAVTISSGSSAVGPVAANLLLTSPGGGMFEISGAQYPGSQQVTGIYDLSGSLNGSLGVGTGSITLTAPAAQTYTIYTLDTLGCTGTPQKPNPACEIQDFFIMDETTTPNPDQNASIIFAKQ
ncbi:MAG: hypothetical protein ABSG02_19590 [Terriglobales bacterium]